MSNWYGSEVDFPPKQGEKRVITIVDGKRVEGMGNEFNLKKKGGVDSGFHLLLKLDTGKDFVVNTWSLFFAFKAVDVKKGDTIEIQHPKVGEYIVTKIKKEEAPKTEWENEEEPC